MKCKKCNIIINDNETFCEKCKNEINKKENNPNIKKEIIKYIKKCFIGFSIIFGIYMLLSLSLKSCFNQAGSDGFDCAISYFFYRILFLIANFAIVLPTVIFSTKKLFKNFNESEYSLKKKDIVFIILLGITVEILIDKVSIYLLLLIPIVILLYFSNNCMSIKASKKIYYLLIIPLILTCFLTKNTFYIVIIFYNILVVPTLSIIFYLLNQNKIKTKFKVSKSILFSIILCLSVYFLTPHVLKNIWSLPKTEKIKNISIKYIDYEYSEVVHIDDEIIYLIIKDKDDGSASHLAKYDINNKELKIIVSNIIDALYAKENIFIINYKSIYMLNIKNNKLKKIIDKKYYSFLNPNSGELYFENENLYFDVGNKIYKYNINNYRISSFTIKEEEYFKFFDKYIFLATNSEYDYLEEKINYIYKLNGEKKKLAFTTSDAIYADKFLYKNYLYIFDFSSDNKLIVENMEKDESYAYDINLDNLYKDETYTYDTNFNNYDINNETNYTNNYKIIIKDFEYLGIYDNKMYFKMMYKNDINNEDYYVKIAYFDIIDDYSNKNEIELKLLAFSLVETWNDDEFAYLSDSNIYIGHENAGIIHKYDLKNDMITNNYLERECCSFIGDYDNYIYVFKISDDIIYRINKNTLDIEKILEKY